MALPIIAGAAAAVAARLAAKKAAQEAAKKAAARTAQIAKNSVKTKPARKPVSNPPDLTKVGNRMIESIARSGGGGRGPLGKKKDVRVVNAKGLRKGTDASAKGTVSAKEWARVPKSDTSRSPFSYKTIKINSAPKKTADSAKTANAKALKAANKPVSKNNRDVGGPLMRNILKNSPPARANRTRLGKPAKKK